MLAKFQYSPFTKTHIAEFDSFFSKGVWRFNANTQLYTFKIQVSFLDIWSWAFRQLRDGIIKYICLQENCCLFIHISLVCVSKVQLIKAGRKLPFWHDFCHLNWQTHIRTLCILPSHHSHSWYQYSTPSQGKVQFHIHLVIFASGWIVAPFQRQWEIPFVPLSSDLWIFGRSLPLNTKMQIR